MTTIRPLVLSSILLAVCFADSALADSELRERFIAASQEMGEGMVELVKSCAPDIDLSGVDVDYTPRMVEAAHCVVDTHIERFGRAETEAMVSEAEAMAGQSFSSFEEMNALEQDYPRLADPALLEINRSCGTLEASNDQQLNRVMRENMARMVGCFTQ